MSPTTDTATWTNLDVLHDRTLQFVQQQQQQQQKDTDKECRLAIAVAGGGSYLTAALASTPGASRTLLEGSTLYDRESFRAYVVSSAVTGNQFVTSQAAQAAARAAWRRAVHGTTTAVRTAQRPTHRVLQQLPYTVGLAGTSQLVTTTVPTRISSSSSSASNTGSRAHVGVQLASGTILQGTAELSTTAERTRRQEDVWVGHYMLECLERALVWRREPHETITMMESTTAPSAAVATNTQNQTNVAWTETTAEGDHLSWEVIVDNALPQTAVQETGSDHANSVLHQAARLVLNARHDRVLLVPEISTTENRTISGWQVVVDTPMPLQSLVFPGSFNPPHTGHVQLAQAALEALYDRQKKDHLGNDVPRIPPTTLWFELSVTNADKPPLSEQVVVERLQHFTRVATELEEHGLTQNGQWGVVLTNAPLFVQKINLFRDDSENQQLSFCIGTDTLVRLVDPKYYGNSHETMMQTLQETLQGDIHFCVGGRVDPKNPTQFCDGNNVVPASLASHFTILPEFRVDISSTELRQQMQASGQKQQ